MAATIEQFKLTYENKVNLKFEHKSGDGAWKTVLSMEENENLPLLMSSASDILNRYFANRIEMMAKAMNQL